MKRISWLLLVVFFLSVVMPGVNLTGDLAMAADTLRVAKITAVQGDVKVLRAGGEKAFPAFKGMGLTQGDSIITGSDGRATLEIAEDKELKIGENSRVMISELVQSQENNADKTSLNLKAGQVYTNVKSKLSPDAKYEIRTPTAVMGVRGTQFFVSLSGGGQAKVVTVEGRVVVTVPQVVTREDGTTVTQEVEIVVQSNQVFVQTGEGADPSSYDLETLTGDEELSLFVLETLQEISQQQPDLINPEILQNLEERIEQAREEQQQQQRQQEQQQEELKPSIQYDSDTGSQSPPTNNRRNNNNDNEDEPEIVILTELEDINLLAGGELPWMYVVETEPAEDVELDVEVEDENIAEASFDGNTLYIYGLEAGSTTVTVTASKEGYLPAEESFYVTVYEDYEEGDWLKTVIAESEFPLLDTDIALDGIGMPHIIYTANDIEYKYWDGSQWREWQDIEVLQVGSSQGELVLSQEGQAYLAYVQNYNDTLVRARFDGEDWDNHSFGSGGELQAENPAIALYDDWGTEGDMTAISVYDAVNGNLYFSFNKQSPVLVDGESSDAGQYSSLVFGYNEETEWIETCIAYYDYNHETETGALKLATIVDPWNSVPTIYVEEIDAEPGNDVGQFVSLVEYAGELHAAYYDSTNGDLKYAVRREGVWSKTTVDSEGDAGRYASLAVDNNGYPHISYYVETAEGGALKYASLDPEEEGQWLIETVDQGDKVGKYSSLAIDTSYNMPHVAYAAKEDGYWTVKHATLPGVMNMVNPAEYSGDEGTFTDLTVNCQTYDNSFDFAIHEGEGPLTAYDDIDVTGHNITIKASYLNSLAGGLHKIWFRFSYGLPALLTIEVNSNPDLHAERSNQKLVYDPVNNRYLMVYEKSIMGDPSQIYGRFIGSNGEELPEFAISGPYGQEPAVVRNGVNGDYLVVWYDSSDWENNQICAQLIDVHGNLQGEMSVVSTGGVTNPTVAYNSLSNEYLIAWEQGGTGDLQTEIWGARMSQAGILQGTELELISKNWAQYDPVLAYSSSSNKYLLVAVDSNDVIGRIINADGSAGSAIFTIPASTHLDQMEPDVVADDTNQRFVTVWRDSRGDWDPDIYGRFISDTGSLGVEFVVNESSGYQGSPSITLRRLDDTVSYLVAWEQDIWDGDWQVYAQWVDDEGELLGTVTDIHGDAEAKVRNPEVAYNSVADNCLAAYELHRSYDNISLESQIISGLEDDPPPSNDTLEIQEQPLAAGETHSLVVRDGQVWFTGYSVGSYTLGLSLVEGLDGVVAVSANDSYSLALKEDGTVWAWGENSIGQLGNGYDYEDSIEPTQVDGLTDIVAISAGASHALALKADGTVWAWGDNNEYKLGIGGEDYKTHTPRQVKADSDNYLTGVVAIGAGFDHSLALKEDGTVWAWGDNSWVQLGQGASSPYEPYPVQVKDSSGAGYISDVAAITAGPFHNLVLKSDGTVWAWGYNYYGQLGDGTSLNKSLPVQVRGVGGVGHLSGIVKIAAGGNWAGHSLALDNSGNTYAWGNGEYGQLGLGVYYERKTSPAEVPGLAYVVDIAAGGEWGTSLFLEYDGTVKACGLNDCGEVGDGSEGEERFAVVPMTEASQSPSEEDIIIMNYVTGPDKVIVNNVPANATVKVYKPSTDPILLGSETLPEGPEVFQVIIDIEEGLPLDCYYVRVSFTEPGKAESKRAEKWLPTPEMRKGTDFEIDNVDYGYGQVTFILTFEQIEAMEAATGKTISKIWGFVGEEWTYFEDLADLEDPSVDKVEITSPDSEIYIGSISKAPGNYPYAIAVYDSSDNVIACYIDDSWITVYDGV